MTKFVYTIYDKIAGESGPLFVSNNDEQAMRSYPLAFRSTPDARYSDFMLCCIGTIDIYTMKIDPFDIPKDITPVMEGGEK